MANKRNLKKQIRYACGDLAGEIILAGQMVAGMEKEKVSEIINDIASLQVESLRHVSFSFDRSASDFGNKAQYRHARSKYNKEAFRRLHDDFRSRIEDIVKSMNAALPQAQKDANKEALRK